MWTMQGSKRFVMPTERKALSAILIIVGLSIWLSAGVGPASDIAFRLNGPLTAAEGEFAGTTAAHPMIPYKRLPMYGFRDETGVMRIAHGTRERTDERFPAKARVYFRPGDPRHARAMGQYADLWPALVIGAGFILVGVRVRLRKKASEAPAGA
jgi:hypothetical protein